MFKQFYPDYDYPSAYNIPYETLYKNGFKGIIFDIDNTLVPHGAPADDNAIRFFKHLKTLGFETTLLSNNKEPRVKSFAQAVQAKYIFKAAKPSNKGYIRAMDKMNTDIQTTIFVGDQLFTNIWGAKRLGILNILTKTIHPKEEIQNNLKRKLERIVLCFYNRQKKV